MLNTPLLPGPASRLKRPGTSLMWLVHPTLFACMGFLAVRVVWALRHQPPQTLLDRIAAEGCVAPGDLVSSP